MVFKLKQYSTKLKKEDLALVLIKIDKNEFKLFEQYVLYDLDLTVNRAINLLIKEVLEELVKEYEQEKEEKEEKKEEEKENQKEKQTELELKEKNESNFIKDWTKEEDQFLSENYRNMDEKEIAEVLNRPIDSIQARVKGLVLTKKKETETISIGQ
jgi:hypothetical protein